MVSMAGVAEQAWMAELVRDRLGLTLADVRPACAEFLDLSAIQ
jgi:hypothetical protein